MHADPDCVGETPLLSIIHLDWIVEVKFDTVFRDRIFIVVTTCVIVIEILKPATFDDRICPFFDCIRWGRLQYDDICDKVLAVYKNTITAVLPAGPTTKKLLIQ